MSKPIDHLRTVPVFDHFQEEQLEALAASANQVRFPAGVTVLQEGDDSFDSYVIREGRIRIKRETSYGSFNIAVLEPGELFGEASFIDRKPRSVDAITREASELLLLNPVALKTHAEKDARFELALYWAFWRSLSKKLRSTNDRLSRFFSETGASSDLDGSDVDEPTGSFRIDLDRKRDLFQEQKLSSMEINFLASLSKEKKYGPDEVLFREGDPGDRMYIVLDGRVRISKNIPGAGEEALAFMERGDYFGEMALIDNLPRSAEARAHEKGAVVLAIPRDVVEGLLDIHKVSSLRLLKILCQMVAERLREIDDKIVGWFILAGGQGGNL
ncbi:MAG: cyclic nucleotide-binding domain-containing protein [Thermoanaerobaculia bacterium]|nr:cyclic nucleotide-binding domain-containing protein [Thermoanaerobaculia bacterium]